MVGELPRVTPVLRADALSDGLERLGDREPIGPAGVDLGRELVVQSGHTDHEELVEVGGEDGEELHPLEQRQQIILDEL